MNRSPDSICVVLSKAPQSGEWATERTRIVRTNGVDLDKLFTFCTL